MDRRTFFLGSAAGVLTAATGSLVLAYGFKQPKPTPKSSELLTPETGKYWPYHPVDINRAGELAYHLYEEGSCMYAMFGSILKQLAEQHGEPYASFPDYMMKYGASGIGSYGSVCGALNGAAAAVGLFVQNKAHREELIEHFFTWYEKTALPIYTPTSSTISIPTSVSDSVLCHASTSKWVKASGLSIEGPERAERCSRLTADVAQKTVGMLNDYFSGQYQTSTELSEETSTCVQCHGGKGKLSNIKGKMECSACHDKSLAHTLFADIHYKYME
ncbi:MAG: C-GCAxxG-C-C family protein [bacterium]|jgi:hypothetical protein|nr:C-GCAxxG-C-C family protein [bacterium]